MADKFFEKLNTFTENAAFHSSSEQAAFRFYAEEKFNDAQKNGGGGT